MLVICYYICSVSNSSTFISPKLANQQLLYKLCKLYLDELKELKADL